MIERLSDLIIDGGPFAAGQLSPIQSPTAAGLNELRDELIAARELSAEVRELRTILAKVDNDECGCLGGPLTIEWATGNWDGRP